MNPDLSSTPTPELNKSFFDKIWAFLRSGRRWWMALQLWQRILSLIIAIVLVGGLVFGGWWIFNEPQKHPAETKTPVKSEPPKNSPDEQPSEKPDEEPSEEPGKPKPKPQPSKTQKKKSGGNNGGSGGGGGGGGGGGSEPPAAFPNADNTGPSGCSSWHHYDDDTLNITVDGTVLNCITLDGTLTINADNVTVKNAILRGTSWWGVRVGNTKGDTTNFKLLNSRLYTIPGQGPDNDGYDYGVSQESTGYMEIAYNHITGYKDGVTTSNSYIHDNYIHDLSQFDGAHTQDIYVYAGPNQVKIEHNTLINDSPQDQATAAIYIAPDDGHQNNRIVTNNFLAGGAYTIYGGDNTATNIVVTNNKFSTQIQPDSGYFGWAAYWWPDNAGNVWSGNTWADGPNAGKTVNP